ARLQPHPSHLTGYYLMLAVGGVVGGFFVGIIAPYWFNSNYELSIGILLTGVVAAIAVIPKANFPSPLWRNASIASTVFLLLGLGWIQVEEHLGEISGSEVTVRNFYGTLQVFANPEGDYRSMLHGQIIHGRQHLAKDKLDLPTTYYSAEGGAGRAMQIKAASGPLRVGVVGLGVGTLVSYGRKEDYFRLYEIDPLVIDIARDNFSYLSRTAASTEIVLGDARLQLELEPAQQFDILVVDAFSGDSVPVHLLTLEAFAQYFRHLKPDGVLAVHITNRFLDLQPVVKSAADHFDKDIRLVSFEGDRERLIFRSRWALISADRAFFNKPQLIDATPIAARRNFQPWKDDYSSIFSILM
ncbi:spermidine synthase, partial [Candidatus Propionivibrio aalborgensis]